MYAAIMNGIVVSIDDSPRIGFLNIETEQADVQEGMVYSEGLFFFAARKLESPQELFDLNSITYSQVDDLIKASTIEELRTAVLTFSGCSK